MAQDANKNFVGIDLGGTNIKVGVLNDAGETLAYLSTPTYVERGPEDATKQELIYTVTDSSGAYPEELTVDNQGMLTFHAQITAKIAYYTVKIAATDNSMVASYVSFMVAGYK